jgi:hypothetical protein
MARLPKVIVVACLGLSIAGCAPLSSTLTGWSAPSLTLSSELGQSLPGDPGPRPLASISLADAKVLASGQELPEKLRQEQTLWQEAMVEARQILAADTVALDRFTHVVTQLKSPTKEGVLPKELAAEPVTPSLVVALSKSLAVHTSKGVIAVDIGLSEQSVDATDFDRFTRVIQSVMNPKNFRARNVTAMTNADFWKAFGVYFDAYVHGEYRADTGALIAKPKFNNGIGNETIGSAVTVLLEFFADWLLPTPVFKDAATDKYITLENKEPTAVTANVRNAIKTDAKFTVKKVKGMQCASGLAGEGGLALGGVVVKSFGGTNLGVTLGLGALGKFSFGDNNTVSKVGETFFEVLFRRGTEHLVYRILRNPPPGSKVATGSQDYACLLDLLP